MASVTILTGSYSDGTSSYFQLSNGQQYVRELDFSSSWQSLCIGALVSVDNTNTQSFYGGFAFGIGHSGSSWNSGIGHPKLFLGCVWGNLLDATYGYYPVVYTGGANPYYTALASVGYWSSSVLVATLATQNAGVENALSAKLNEQIPRRFFICLHIKKPTTSSIYMRSYYPSDPPAQLTASNHDYRKKVLEGALYSGNNSSLWIEDRAVFNLQVLSVPSIDLNSYPPDTINLFWSSSFSNKLNVHYIGVMKDSSIKLS